MESFDRSGLPSISNRFLSTTETWRIRALYISSAFALLSNPNSAKVRSTIFLFSATMESTTPSWPVMLVIFLSKSKRSWGETLKILANLVNESCILLKRLNINPDRIPFAPISFLQNPRLCSVFRNYRGGIGRRKWDGLGDIAQAIQFATANA